MVPPVSISRAEFHAAAGVRSAPHFRIILPRLATRYRESAMPAGLDGNQEIKAMLRAGTPIAEVPDFSSVFIYLSEKNKYEIFVLQNLVRAITTQLGLRETGLRSHFE